MKVGLFLNTQFPEGDSLAARLPELVEQVRLARGAGFASLWFPDHYLIGPVQMPQPMPLMAWLLREAEGMMVGPNIRILPLLNPVMVAEEAATMDLLSGGRYALGVGLGYREAEFTAFGIPMGERAPRLAEQIALMRRLWTEETRHPSRPLLHGGGGKHQLPSGHAGRAADLCRGPGGCGGAPCGAYRRRLADHQFRAYRHGGGADGAVPRGAGGGRADATRIPDRARMLCRRLARHRLRGMPRCAALQIRGLCLLGARPWQHGCRDVRHALRGVSSATASSSATRCR